MELFILYITCNFDTLYIDIITTINVDVVRGHMSYYSYITTHIIVLL
jgi:hypothetical protein